MKNLILLCSLLATIACAPQRPISESMAGGGSSVLQPSHDRQDLISTAVTTRKLNVLTSLINAAGLSSALTGDEMYTIFAPSDEAFAKLPPATVSALLNDKTALQQLLLYHVVKGKVPASVASALTGSVTVAGPRVRIRVSGGNLFINQAKVTDADIFASNGVIHVIDSVITPPQNIIETAQAAGSFSTLLTLLEAAGLTDVFKSLGPITLFAPTDEAFNKIPASTRTALLQNLPLLRKVLLYHVLSGEVPSSTAVTLTSATTASGFNLQLSISGGDLFINSSRVVAADIFAKNGVIHVIDTVLIPPQQ